ncbi:lytic transglycosylase domain-containing protein [Streptomyces sp. S465]|uniref:lytic transglycosylase domain-containing protein n=1 Tax=Streptomyces sp. S465 TaxID=2979468 RepID=UPI0022A81B54|nr:lytic murein transglycosylase [Streptomyces sp. S465]WAP55428.1 lytic murein transglycosylase [Streptomyces sp. S465]
MAPLIGRRLRKGAATTAVAAAAMAALTASQAPGFANSDHGDRNREQRAGEAPAPDDTPIDGGSSYHTDLPPLVTPDKPGSSVDLPGLGNSTKPEAGIPASVLAAYKKAEAALRESNPGCNLPWQLLAAIGKVESGQARGGNVDANGTTVSPILGPVLNGDGFALIKDTDGGAYDGDSTHDRAVGPMQFIPSTWASWGRDGNGDGEKDPNNIYDAALAAGSYLCAGGRDLSVKADLDSAILGYNHSQEYLNTVLSWFEYYKRGTHEVPDGTGVLPSGDKSSGGSGDKDKDTGKGSGAGKDTGNGGEHDAHTLPKPDGDSESSTPTPPADGDDGTPGSQTPAPKPPTTTPPTTPSGTSKLTTVGAQRLSAVAGTNFAQSPQVKAVDAAGKPVAGAKVRYEILGETDARFLGLVTSATVLTGSDGTATAPKLLAGEKAGAFTVRATAVGREAAPVEFAATVTARPVPQADALARIGDKKLTAQTGGSFADALTVTATNKGKATADVPVTATMITSAEQPEANDKGPYFLDAAGKPVRTLTGLKTNASGQLTLPKILTDDQAGTFLLRLTTEGGAVLDVELTVTQAPAS